MYSYLCGRCRGTGQSEDGGLCPHCRGWGALPGFLAPCHACGGRGKRNRTTCPLCSGSGRLIQAVRFEEATLPVFPVSLIRQALLEARAGVPSKLPEYIRGAAAGILLALQEHGEEWGLPPGYQLAAILREGGWLAVAPDGIWHFTKDDDPVVVAPFVLVRQK